jgi:alpha-N-acetylglucosamine transferase
MTNTENAFVIVHFGNKPKYLELEIYLSISLRKNSKNDIVYFYSINDTPQSFVNIMKKYCTHVISYNDNNITFNIKDFPSIYPHFNTLRTCNFLFAYQLTQYKKICLIESDTIILNNIDDIFTLKTPSALVYINKEDQHNYLKNDKIKLDVKHILTTCENKSYMNGGALLIKPSIAKYKAYIKTMKIIIEKKCCNPNETLFLIVNKTIYNLPFKYNGVQFDIDRIGNACKIDMRKYLSIVHVSTNEYKHIEFIRDGYLEKYKVKKATLCYFINIFKKLYYDKYNQEISKELMKLS